MRYTGSRFSMAVSACCQAFSLPYSPGQLWERYTGEIEPPLMDQEIIIPMVRYIGLQWRRGYLSHVYTCTNLGADGRCTIYESRPEMCRLYGDSNSSHPVCEYHNCESTWCAHHADRVKGERE
jgi:Fe-S-cluster containining protein